MINPDAKVVLDSGLEVHGTGLIESPADEVSIDVSGMATLTFHLFGTIDAGAINFFASHNFSDGQTTVPAVNLFKRGRGSHQNTESFEPGLVYAVPCAGLQEVKLVANDDFDGSITVDWATSPLLSAVYVAGNVVHSQGSLDGVGNGKGLLDDGVKCLGDRVGEPIYVPVVQMVHQGNAGWFKQYTPNTFLSLQVNTVGPNTVWGVGGGFRFRLMKYMIVVTGNATLTTPGILTIQLLDDDQDIFQNHDVFVPAVSLAGPTLYNSGWIDLGNGIPSGDAERPLNVVLSDDLASGVVRVFTGGIEE